MIEKKMRSASLKELIENRLFMLHELLWFYNERILNFNPELKPGMQKIAVMKGLVKSGYGAVRWMKNSEVTSGVIASDEDAVCIQLEKAILDLVMFTRIKLVNWISSTYSGREKDLIVGRYSAITNAFETDPLNLKDLPTRQDYFEEKLEYRGLAYYDVKEGTYVTYFNLTNETAVQTTL